MKTLMCFDDELAALNHINKQVGGSHMKSSEVLHRLFRSGVAKEIDSEIAMPRDVLKALISTYID